MDNNFISENNKNFFEDSKENINIKYEKIYIKAAETIRKEIEFLKPVDPCKNCIVKDCNIENKEIFTMFPQNCKFRNWQFETVTFLTGEYFQKIKNEFSSLMEEKNNCTCNKCGACCKLAVNDCSFEQLKQKAIKGDNYAKEFVSIYIPYTSEEEARNANPVYYDNLNSIVTDDKIYYYHCKKLVNNICSDYNNRPNICKEFPNNPLKMLPVSCSYKEWQNNILEKALLIQAKIGIIQFYKEKLQ